MRVTILTAVSLLGIGRCALSQVCTDQWLPGPPVPGADDFVWSELVFAFPGPVLRPPELVIAGTFDVAGDARVSAVAAWDGANWRPIGDLYAVVALGTFDPDGDGPAPAALVASGRRTAPGAQGVMLWTGAAWQDLGACPTGAYSLVQFDPDGPGPLASRLFAGGYGNAAINAVSQWDGRQWLPVGAGLADPYGPGVYSMTVFDPDGEGPLPERLVVGGVFRFAGGVPANGIAEWNGSSWSPLGLGITHASTLGGYVWALTEFDPDASGPAPPELIAAGTFETAGGQPARSAAAWNGSSWRALPGLGNYAFVFSAMPFDPDGTGPAPERLIAYGRELSQSPYATIMQWDGATWSTLGAGVGVTSSNAYRSSLAAYPPASPGETSRLIAASQFVDAGTGGARNIAAWDGSAWSAIAPGFEDRLTGLTTFDADGPGPLAREIVAAGDFLNTPSGPASRIARFDGSVWRPLGDGLLPRRSSYGSLFVTRWQPDTSAPEVLVAAGLLDHAGGVPVSNVALWNGTGWSAAGETGFAQVVALGTYVPGTAPGRPALAAAGYAVSAGLVVKDWDGVSSWRQLGEQFWIPGPNEYPELHTIAYHAPGGSVAPGLYIGGYFSRIGQSAIATIARWDGSAWQPVGNGIPEGTCYALCDFDPDGTGPQDSQLVAVGNLAPFGSAATWDGAVWHSMPSAVFGTFTAVTVRDSGPGSPPDLFAAANTYYGMSELLRWNGTTFVQVGETLTGPYSGPSIDALATWQPPDGSAAQVCVGGYFSATGTRPSAFFARWACAPPASCYPNCDGSTAPPSLNIQDFVCFLNRFAAGEPYGNCDGSTVSPVLNVYDFFCFLNRFAQGCP